MDGDEARDDTRTTGRAAITTSAYRDHSRPLLAQTLEALGLDAVYRRAEGDYLWREASGPDVRVLDLVGGYGAGLLGHNHSALLRTIRRLAAERRPFLAQGSIRRAAGALAEELVDAVGGGYVALFASTGAEMVEAALKHAHLETGRAIFWTVRGGFHGKTSGAGAISVPRENGAGPAPGVCVLDPDDARTWLAAEEATGNHLAAAIFEPILGEGGVRPLPIGFVSWLADACGARRAPLIADEIQTGMGRTGAILASRALGISPDYVCLSKSLGGGLAKIGALLIRRDRLVGEFTMTQTSTFGEDEWSCEIARSALKIIRSDGFLTRVETLGQGLLAELEALRSRFPGPLLDVRGRGLMLGVELNPDWDGGSNLVKMLSQSRLLGWAAAAYLLNVHRIRVAPTLTDPFTLRLQPSAYLREDAVHDLLAGLSQLCETLEAGDAAHLVGFAGQAPARRAATPPARSERRRATWRVAFVGHLIAADHARLADPSLGRLADHELEGLIDRSSRFLAPALLQTTPVRSPRGPTVDFSFIGLNLTSAQIVQARAAGDVNWITAKIESAVVLAKELGCRVSGLGGYTSSLTGGCRRVRTNGIALTSGNSLTVGMAIRAIEEAGRELGLDWKGASVGVVGAPGNIASTYARLVAPRVARVVLVVRRRNSARVARLAKELRRHAPQTAIVISESLDALEPCTFIVAASTSGGGLIQPRHLGRTPVVICDVSLPSDIDARVHWSCPHVAVLDGGIVRLPCDPQFVLPGVPLEAGHVFACAGETLLMGLERSTTSGSVGALTPEGVNRALHVADRHGFTLARPKIERSL